MKACRTIRRSALLLVAVSSLALPRAGAAQSPLPGTTAIVGVTIIDGTGAPQATDMTVIVTDGRLAEIGVAGQLSIPAGADVIEAHGKYLLPGFIDTHAHVSLGPVEMDVSAGSPAMRLTHDPSVALRTMRTLLAHGITSLRDPGGDPAQLVSLREAVASGALVGPRMRVAGKVIDQTPFEGLVNRVENEAEVRAAVRDDARAGVDMVKLYVTLTPDLLGAAIDEAHNAGIDAVGHLMMTSWTEAAELGIDNILHIVPGSAELLPEGARSDYLGMMSRGTQFMYGWFEHVEFDSPEIAEMLDALVAHGVSVDPTLVIFEGMIRGDDPYYTENDALTMAAPSLLANWRAFFSFNAGWTPEDFTAARKAWPKFLELTKRLHDAGVTLTAGTDANNPWIVPGHSFHRELELLVEAGIDPIEVVKIATHNGAEVSGTLEDTGTIETGKWADLVLLDASPLDDISNSRSIEWVMQAGRIMRPDDLLVGIR